MLTRGKAVAVLAGLPLSLGAMLCLGLLLGNHSSLIWPLLAAVFAAAGAALGYFWPADGWRLGLCLGLCRLALVPPALFLAGDVVRWDGRGVVMMFVDVLAFVAPVFAACFGAAAGALVREHRGARA